MDLQSLYFASNHVKQLTICLLSELIKLRSSCFSDVSTVVVELTGRLTENKVVVKLLSVESFCNNRNLVNDVFQNQSEPSFLRHNLPFWIEIRTSVLVVSTRLQSVSLSARKLRSSFTRTLMLLYCLLVYFVFTCKWLIIFFHFIFITLFDNFNIVTFFFQVFPLFTLLVQIWGLLVFIGRFFTACLLALGSLRIIQKIVFLCRADRQIAAPAQLRVCLRFE